MDSHKIYRLIISNQEEKHKKKAVEAGRIVVAVGPRLRYNGATRTNTRTQREPVPFGYHAEDRLPAARGLANGMVQSGRNAAHGPVGQLGDHAEFPGGGCDAQVLFQVVGVQPFRFRFPGQVAIETLASHLEALLPKVYALELLQLRGGMGSLVKTR